MILRSSSLGVEHRCGRSAQGPASWADVCRGPMAAPIGDLPLCRGSAAERPKFEPTDLGGLKPGENVCRQFPSGNGRAFAKTHPFTFDAAE